MIVLSETGDSETMNVYRNVQKLKIEGRAFINGKYVEPDTGEYLRKTSPADGSVLPGIAVCGEAELEKAVRTAEEAFESGVWSRIPVRARKEAILKLADLMEKNLEELALLDTLETGRAYSNYTEDSLPKAIQAMRYFAEASDKLYGKAIQDRGDEFGLVVREPLGVVGLITSWNDPLVVDAWKLAPALLMGNSVIMKPAEEASFSLLRLASMTREAGIPDGVFHVLPGYGAYLGKGLALHRDVRGISFTGSVPTGKKIMEYAGKSNMKRVCLECGGKGPYIVTARCGNVEEAARVLAANMFYNQGQICSAPSRALVSEELYEPFVRAFCAESERYVPGDPFETENKVGCVVSRKQYDRVCGWIDTGVSEGARLYQAKAQKPHHPEACCIQPAVFTDVTPDMQIAREEIFGPVACVLKVKNTEEALAVANDSEFGLAGAIWTDNTDEAYRAARALRVGLVHINSYGNDDDSAPFGGVRQSGTGKDKSVYAFESYCDKKTVWMHFR